MYFLQTTTAGALDEVRGSRVANGSVFWFELPKALPGSGAVSRR